MTSVAIFDLETDGFLETCTRVWCGVIKDIDTDKVRGYGPDEISEFMHILRQYDVLIGHNCLAFDFRVLNKLYGFEFTGKKVDTLLISRMQRPDRVTPPLCRPQAGPHSVEAWGYRLGRGKVRHEDWTRFTPEMLHRCKEDVEIQHLIYKELINEGRGEGWANAHRLNNKLFELLYRQEDYGWYVDRPFMDSCISTLDRWLARIDRAILPKLPLITECLETKKDGEYSYVNKPFLLDGSLSKRCAGYFADSGSVDNIVGGSFSRVKIRSISLDSVSEVKEFLLSLGWQPKEWNLDAKGKPRSPKFSKDEPFAGIQGSLGKLIAKRIQCKQRKSIIEGWINSIRLDGRIAAKVAGMATTGRLKHAGIVNVPNPNSKAFFAKQMRQIFIAKPGWVLVGTDSKGNQMRQLAARMGDEEFTKAVLFGNSKDGTDLHSLNMKRTGIDSRSRAKNFFYGCILFGAGDKKTAKILETNMKEAQAIKARYFEEMPKFSLMLEEMRKDWRKSAKKTYNDRFQQWEYHNGFIKGLDGRPILVELEKDILVYYLQSDEAIQMGAAYCWLDKQLEKRGYKHGIDWGYVIWMHDEWQLECRPEIAEEIAKLGNEAVTWAGRYYNIKCPHEGESKIGKNWYETH